MRATPSARPSPATRAKAQQPGAVARLSDVHDLALAAARRSREAAARYVAIRKLLHPQARD